VTVVYNVCMGKIYVYDSETFNLFKSNPSFKDGVFELINMNDVSEKYNISNSVDEADTKALYSDWKEVGKDISSAINNYNESVKVN
jgi:hypothetical protein